MKLALSFRLIFWSSGLAVAPSLLLAGCGTHPPAQAAPVSVASVPVSSVPNPQPAAGAGSGSDSSDSKMFTTSGPLVAEQQADVATERDGRVVNIAVGIGDHVRSGQLLAKLDDRALQSAYESQKAKVASLQAQVNEWESEQKVEEADLRRADIMRAEKIRSEEDWEHVKYRLDETIAEVARYRADKVAAEADLQSASLQLEQSRIVAPFSGVVGRNSVRLTQEVKKGDVLFWITAEAPLRVLFTVPESAMAAFPIGAPLELTTADLPQLRQQARVLRVSPVVDPASGSLQVIGTVVRPSPQLKPGMTMQIRRTP
jgi:RND family efflux transporter MFP subunit